MTHRRAVVLMIVATLLWGIAGVVARWLHTAEPFEITFWRSLFTVVALALLLPALRGPAQVLRALREGGPALWLSGLCWSVMFTAFMVGIALTTVANVLVTMALAPLFAALLARFALGHRLAPRTWGAILVAGIGIGWMYGAEVQGGDGRHLLGVAVALGVPVFAAVNWTVLQHIARTEGARVPQDMLPAVLIGALLSALAMLPLAWPLNTDVHDLSLLALLGCVQLAIPCLMAVAAARVLPAPEMALLALLEVIFGVALAWLGAGEAPSVSVLGGGALVLAALVFNEALALKGERWTSSPKSAAPSA